MHTLLIRLAGPMQSWGMSSRFTERDTATEPTKSGLIGLICSALGRTITEPIEDLARLPLGIRVDREGKLKYDYQTAENVVTAEGSKKTVVSKRYYLADAVFLAGFESEDLPLLEIVALALKVPRWQVSLGRKSYLPSKSIYITERPDSLPGHPAIPGILDLPLREALFSFPPLCEIDESVDRLRLIIESENGTIARRDVPISFESREFNFRKVSVEFIPIKREGGSEDVPDAVVTL